MAISVKQNNQEQSTKPVVNKETNNSRVTFPNIKGNTIPSATPHTKGNTISISSENTSGKQEVQNSTKNTNNSGDNPITPTKKDSKDNTENTNKSPNVSGTSNTDNTKNTSNNTPVKNPISIGSQNNNISVGSNHVVTGIRGKIIPIKDNNGNIVSNLHNGDIVKAKQVQEGIHQVTDGQGNSVYVKSSYVKPATPEALSNGYYRVVNTGDEGLALRYSPDNNEGSFEVIPNGTVIGVIRSMNSEWAKVSYNGQVGWVHARFLRPNDVSTSGKEVQDVSSNEGMDISNINWNAPQSYTVGQLATESSKFENMRHYNLEFLKNNVGARMFLATNEYRGINVNTLNQDLQGQGVLQGQGKTIAEACKYYHLDPIYFTAQAAIESAHGHSTMATGTYINGTKVYNLFGIMAYDSDPSLGSVYAYRHGWTSPQKAIWGAARFISKNYANSNKYEQNTPWRLIHSPNGYTDHSYCTSTSYAKLIAEVMSQYDNAYTSNDTFEFIH